MTMQQWYDFAVKEWEVFDRRVRFPTDPEDWLIQREFILEHIRDIDNLTAIYRRESGK